MLATCHSHTVICSTEGAGSSNANEALESVRTEDGTDVAAVDGCGRQVRVHNALFKLGLIDCMSQTHRYGYEAPSNGFLRYAEAGQRECILQLCSLKCFIMSMHGPHADWAAFSPPGAM